MSLIIKFFITFFYQPLFNLLVLIYQGVDFLFKRQDMGIAVILFTIIFRLFILPLSIASGRSEAEKRKLSKKLDELKQQYSDNPVAYKTERRKLFHSNPRMVIAEVFDISLQILIALMFYRIFTSGITGGDFPLLYSFVKPPQNGFELNFLEQYNLTKSNFHINIVNSLVIFTAESLNIAFSPFSPTREDKMALLVLPLAAFLFFSQMPAGKKLFIITTLSFTIVLILAKQTVYVYHNLISKMKN